ncbi:MAG: LCP family protein [Acidimicrobiia bacterium]|nr:LCP family protein [Acidimicrobiia bacterium]
MREVPFADLDVDGDIPAFLLAEPEEVEQEPPARAVVLPPSGTGVRRHRRRQQRRDTRRRGAGLVLGGVGAVGAVALLLVVAHPWRGGAPASGPPPAAASRSVPLPSSAVLVEPGPQGAASITLLVANATSGGGHIVFVPPATMTEVPSYGLDGVGKALGEGGPSLFEVTLENLLGVPLPPAVVTSDAQLTGFVQPAGPLGVDVPTSVEQTDAAGNVNVLWDQGPTTLAPTDVPRFLTVRGQGNDLSRLARHQAFWTAWLGKVAHDPGVVDGLPPDLSRVVRQLATGSVSYQTLPVQAVDAGSGGDEVYRVNQADLDQLMGQLLPGVPPDRIRVQVLNGTGAIQASPRVAKKIVPAGGRVVLSGNADSFAYAQTQIVFYDRSQQQAAERIRQALGTGRLVLSRQPLDVVDVTVVIGKDFNG